MDVFEMQMMMAQLAFIEQYARRFRYCPPPSFDQEHRRMLPFPGFIAPPQHRLPGIFNGQAAFARQFNVVPVDRSPIEALAFGRGEPVSIPGYKLVKALRKGGQAQSVNLLKDKRTGRLVVEKRVQVGKRTRGELRALQRMSGNNVNKMADYLANERRGFCTFLLEHCDKGDLGNMMQSQSRSGRKFDEILAGMSSVALPRGSRFYTMVFAIFREALLTRRGTPSFT